MELFSGAILNPRLSANRNFCKELLRIEFCPKLQNRGIAGTNLAAEEEIAAQPCLAPPRGQGHFLATEIAGRIFSGLPVAPHSTSLIAQQAELRESFWHSSDSALCRQPDFLFLWWMHHRTRAGAPSLTILVVIVS